MCVRVCDFFARKGVLARKGAHGFLLQLDVCCLLWTDVAVVDCIRLLCHVFRTQGLGWLLLQHALSAATSMVPVSRKTIVRMGRRPLQAMRVPGARGLILPPAS